MNSVAVRLVDNVNRDSISLKLVYFSRELLSDLSCGYSHCGNAGGHVFLLLGHYRYHQQMNLVAIMSYLRGQRLLVNGTRRRHSL